ncbi:MAG: hypothetical protein P8Z35_01080 [Ignavibacteriaceae bacterium]
MKNLKSIINVISLILLLGLNYNLSAQIKEDLEQPYNLAGERTTEPQFFILQTIITNYSLDGTRTGKELYKLYLQCKPAEVNGNNVYKYTCSKFEIGSDDSNLVTIPSLDNWSYIYGYTLTGYDEKGQIFGIEQSRFENLADENGQHISKPQAYWIYNSFIDFHAFCNVFAEPTHNGGGIQDLIRINQEIIHSSSNSEPPVNLGSNIKKGSYYKNGLITLTFTGLGMVKNATCAIVTFDAGEGSFKMKMKPMPSMEITTVGSSHYKGNLFINMSSFWVEKVIMDEFVLSETTIQGQTSKMNSVAERRTIINNIDKSVYQKALMSIN